MEDHRIELLLVAAELDLLHLGSASSSYSSSWSSCAWHMAHSLCEFIYIYILYIAIRIIVITRHVYLCTAPPSSSASSSPSTCTSPSGPSIPCDRSSLIWFYGLRILCKAKLCDHWWCCCCHCHCMLDDTTWMMVEIRLNPNNTTPNKIIPTFIW